MGNANVRLLRSVVRRPARPGTARASVIIITPARCRRSPLPRSDPGTARSRGSGAIMERSEDASASRSRSSCSWPAYSASPPRPRRRTSAPESRGRALGRGRRGSLPRLLRGGRASPTPTGAAATAVLLRIDTPGGLSSSMRDIIQAIVVVAGPGHLLGRPRGRARRERRRVHPDRAAPSRRWRRGRTSGPRTRSGCPGAIESQKAENDAAAYIRSLAEPRGPQRRLGGAGGARVGERHRRGGPRART